LAADDVLDMFRRRVRPRARHLPCYVHPSLHSEFSLDARLVLGGRDAAREPGAPVDLGDFDIYVKDSDAAGALDSYGAVPAVGNPNLGGLMVLINAREAGRSDSRGEGTKGGDIRWHSDWHSAGIRWSIRWGSVVVDEAVGRAGGLEQHEADEQRSG
jgi:hypothetical protein